MDRSKACTQNLMTLWQKKKVRFIYCTLYIVYTRLLSHFGLLFFPSFFLLCLQYYLRIKYVKSGWCVPKWLPKQCDDNVSKAMNCLLYCRQFVVVVCYSLFFSLHFFASSYSVFFFICCSLKRSWNRFKVSRKRERERANVWEHDQRFSLALHEKCHLSNEKNQLKYFHKILSEKRKLRSLLSNRFSSIRRARFWRTLIFFQPCVVFFSLSLPLLFLLALLAFLFCTGIVFGRGYLKFPFF